MKKFVLAIVTVMLFAGGGRAETVAGQDVVVPLPPPGITTQIAEGVTKVAMRLKGMALGSLVRKGMTTEQVQQLLGRNGSEGGADNRWHIYSDLGLTVHTTLLEADGGWTFRVADVSFSPLSK